MRRVKHPFRPMFNGGFNVILETERAVLASLVLDNGLIGRYSDALKPEYFSHGNSKVFQAIVKLYERHGMVDFVLLSSEIEELSSIFVDSERLPFAVIPAHLDVLKKAYQKRIAKVRLQTAIKALDDGEEVTDMIAGLSFDDLMAEEEKFKNTEQMMIEALKTMDRGTKEVLRTGIKPIDNLIGGMQLGELWIVAGRTSMGKSALALTILMKMVAAKIKVALILAEGNQFDLTCRILAQRTGIENSRIRTGRLDLMDYSTIQAEVAKVSQYPLIMLEREHRWDRVRSMLAYRKAVDPALKVFCLDYVGLFSAPVARPDRYLEVGRISFEAKQLAEQRNMAALLLCQLNRNADIRKDGIPRLSDLRESGNLEQDADVVILLHGSDTGDEVDLIVAKGRNSLTGTTSLRFNRKAVRFEEL